MSLWLRSYWARMADTSHILTPSNSAAVDIWPVFLEF